MTIDVSDAEAALFMEFRRNQQLWTALVSLGLLELRDGSMTIHVGHSGQMTVERKQTTILRTKSNVL